MTVYTPPPALLDSSDSILVERLAEHSWNAREKREASGPAGRFPWNELSSPDVKNYYRDRIRDILDELARMVRDGDIDDGIWGDLAREPYGPDGACKLCGCVEEHG